MKIYDKVYSRLSLWKDTLGTITGIIKIENGERGDLVHVLYPETDKHCAFQQSFYSKDILVRESYNPTKDIIPFSNSEIKALTYKSQYQIENEDNLWK